MKLFATALTILFACVVTPVNAFTLATGATLATGSSKFSVEVAGVSRTVITLVPTVDNQCLVIAMHGGGGSASFFARKAKLDQMASDTGCIVAVPDGIDKTWNAGDGKHWVNDLALMDFIIAEVGTDRVYATGMSRGGMMAYWLACNRDIDAIAVVAGTLIADICPDASGIDVLHIHGSDDQIVPYNGNSNSPPIAEGLNRIIDQNQCGSTALNPTISIDDRTEYSVDCPSGDHLELIKIDNGGHSWPGTKASRDERRADIYICQHFNATAYIGEFFTQSGA